MRKEYDFTDAKKNPYPALLKKHVTIRLESITIAYFKKLSMETGIPYQNLINLYLRDCVVHERKLNLHWAA